MVNAHLTLVLDFDIKHIFVGQALSLYQLPLSLEDD